MIKHIIWDFDGTLFDTYPAIARSYASALCDFGHKLPINSILDLSLNSKEQCINSITDMFKLQKEEFVEHFQMHYRSIHPDEQPPFSGTAEICILIKTGVGIISS